MSLQGKTILITGASSGIGAAIARLAATKGASLILFARSEDKLNSLEFELRNLSSKHGTPSAKISTGTVDVSSYDTVVAAVKANVAIHGGVDILINNAGIALGAPAPFWEQKIEEIDSMLDTNVRGMMYVTHAVLKHSGMMSKKAGTIINVTSTTGLEVPPFPGEAVYHTSKAAQEAFTNVLRTELQGTNIKVQALRPGVVATHFHEQRVGNDKGLYDEFMKGMEPLIAEDVAEAAVMMMVQGERVSIKALDVVPTSQRSLQVMDRTWKERNGIKD